MKKPYIKKIGGFHHVSVWRVDGTFIREHIDEEFTNFGQHYQFHFIPKNEFWLDKESRRGEQRFLIDHLLVEHRLMETGKTYVQAVTAADRIEKREREKSAFMKAKLRIIPKNRGKAKLVHRQLLKRYSNGFKVWLVDGELVRDLFFVEFTEGGHDKVYDFIPKNEVWLDDDNNPDEQEFILLHELHERNLMARGWSYNRSHNSSSKLEYYCRRHRDKLAKKLNKELHRT